MDIVGDRKFVEVPGDKTHELPPLLVSAPATSRKLERMMEMASQIIESEDLLAPDYGSEPAPGGPPAGLSGDFERRRMDLALNLVDQYLTLLNQWQWGDGILEWIRQCETTFDTRSDLRTLLRPDVWPHAGRTSFVTLLSDKGVKTNGIPLHQAVGLRLTFRQPPPISCFSNQFLLLLNSTVSETAYDKWAQWNPDPVSSLPPERFRFDVYQM